MSIRLFLLGAAGALGLSLAAASAQAAPVSGPASSLKAAAGESSALEQVYWGRRCWRHRGHLHCRRHWVRDYGYRPYYYDPYYYRPSFGFFFGGHRHHRHHRHW